MWLDDIKPGDNWMGIWKLKFHCGNCMAIIDENPCAVCGYLHLPHIIPGIPEDQQIPQITYMGAVSEHTYVTLQMMQREWERPLLDQDDITDLSSNKIPQRILIVLLFWSLFESLMERLLKDKLKNMPENIRDYLLKKNSTISARMNEFYKLLFGYTFKNDLEQIGYSAIYKLLIKVQDRRNKFIHDHPAAIDEQLVSETIEQLQNVQAAWIAIYNLRCTTRT